MKLFYSTPSTCQKGKWSCTVGDCFGTCSIYGNGHYITFDGKQYDFDGDCEYVAVQVGSVGAVNKSEKLLQSH